MISTILVYLWVALIVIFIAKIFLTDKRTVRHIKENHRQFYEENIGFFSGGASGSTIYQYAKKLGDPIIENMEKKRNKAIKQLVISGVLSFLIIAIYVIMADKMKH